MDFDGGWLRTSRLTSAGHASAQREVGRLVLKPPPSVSTLAFRKSVSENAIEAGDFGAVGACAFEGAMVADLIVREGAHEEISAHHVGQEAFGIEGAAGEGIEHGLVQIGCVVLPERQQSGPLSPLSGV